MDVNIEFLFTLALDGLLGVLCGWMLRGWLQLEKKLESDGALQREIRTLQDRLNESEEAVRMEQKNAAQNREGLSAAAEGLHQTEARLRTASAELAAITKIAAETNAALAASTTELASAHAEIAQLREMVAEKYRRVTALETRVAELEPALPKVVAIPAEQTDDLKMIFGIGKVCEKKLHEAGIRRFSQIAAWSKEDIARIKTMLPKWGDRVHTWVEGARKEHEKKYGRALMQMAS